MGFKLTSSLLLVFLVGFCLFTAPVRADEDEIEEIDATGTVEDDIGKSRDGSRTDDEVVKREEEQIKLDGLNVSQLKELREKAEKQNFVAEVNRMMKLIINSLYKNKEIFLRELISNASDALDKIRFLALTDKNVLSTNEELVIRIKADKENRMLHITDSGVGMTKEDLVKYLGTIAKSETSEFLSKVQQAQSEDSKQSMTDLIGQFGVGFYSAFLVADKVIVSSKNNNDEQHIWESDSTYFQVSTDPRGNTLGRGTTISLHLKEEAQEFLEEAKLKEIIRKYSQFINFNIFLWTSKTVSEEVADEDVAEKKDEDATVEAEGDKKEATTKKVDKTVYDWELMNEAKPIWQRKPSEVEEKEYFDFYKAFSKETEEPLGYSHFVAEGEVTFKSVLFVPKKAPSDIYSNFNKKQDTIKLFVRRVFITDTTDDLIPKFLNFVRGIVDSDDLPLNVSRETLQQNKLLKVIKKKLVRKILDMIKKMDEVQFETFWKEYGTNIKLGVIEDTTNRVRLAKLLRFYSSSSGDKQTSLEQYVKNMKDKQETIYYIAGTSKDEVAKSPFVEKLLKKGYEVLYLIDAIDEYCMQSIPNFEGKNFQNVAKDGVKLDKSKAAEERAKELEKTYEPLIKWIKDNGLKDKVESVKISSRLVETPMALVASQYGYSGNMERITKAQAYQKTGGDSMSQYYFNQKKILEINPGHPLIKELLKRVESDAEDPTAKDSVTLMFESATIRSGYEVGDSKGFADRIERMLRSTLNISPEEKVEEEPIYEDDVPAADADAENVDAEEEPSSVKKSCGTCRKILGIMGVDGTLNKKKEKIFNHRETGLVARKHNNRYDDDEEKEEEEDDVDEHKIVLIKKISPSKALFRRVIIKPSKSGEPIKETMIKVEKKKSTDGNDDDDHKIVKQKLEIDKKTEKQVKSAKTINVKEESNQEKKEKDKIKQELTNKKKVDKREKDEEDDDDDKETSNSKNKSFKIRNNEKEKTSSRNQKNAEKKVEDEEKKQTKKVKPEKEKLNEEEIVESVLNRKNIKETKKQDDKQNTGKSEKVEPKNNNSNKKETNKIEDEEKNIKNKDHQKLNKKKLEPNNKNNKKHLKAEEQDEIEEVEEIENKCSKNAKSRKDCNGDKKEKVKIEEKNNQKNAKTKEDDNEKNKKEDKKSRQKKTEIKPVEDSKITELTKKQLANFKGIWGLIRTIFTISSTEEIDGENHDDKQKSTVAVEVSSKHSKEEKHKTNEKGKRKLLSIEEAETNFYDQKGTDKYVTNIKKLDLYASNETSLGIFESNNQEKLIEFSYITYEIHSEDDKKSVNFQKRKILSVDNKKASKGSNNPKKTQEKAIKKNEKPVIIDKSPQQEKLQKFVGIHKPKVGWEYRYRIYRYAQETGNPVPTDEDYDLAKLKQQELEKSAKLAEETYVEEFQKPKVGWEYRYRITKWKDANPDKVLELKKVADIEKNENIVTAKQIKKIKSKSKKDDDCDENPNAIVFGRFRLDKNKIGKVGWEYRYRISKKLNQLLENSNGKTVDKGQDTLIPIEIVDYLDDPEIPYCDQIDGSKLGTTYGQRRRVKYDDDDDDEYDNEEEEEEDKPENKPKVGWEYRYRISKMMEAKGIKIEPKKIKKSQDRIKKINTKLSKTNFKSKDKENDDDDDDEDDDDEKDIFSPELKPKVGWEYRYRIQRRIEAENNDPNLKNRIISEKYKKALEQAKQEKIEKILPVGENLNTHNIGWEYRYRLSRKLEVLQKQIEDLQNQTKSVTEIVKSKDNTSYENNSKHSKTETNKLEPVKKSSKKEVLDKKETKKLETVKKDTTKEEPVKKAVKNEDLHVQKETKKEEPVKTEEKKEDPIKKVLQKEPVKREEKGKKEEKHIKDTIKIEDKTEEPIKKELKKEQAESELKTEKLKSDLNKEEKKPIKKTEPKEIKKEPNNEKTKIEEKKDTIQAKQKTEVNDKKKIEEPKKVEKSFEDIKEEVGIFNSLLHYLPKFFLNVFCLHTDKYKELCGVKEVEPKPIPEVLKDQEGKRAVKPEPENLKIKEQSPINLTNKVPEKQENKKYEIQKKFNKANPKITKITAKLKQENVPKVIYANEYKKISKNSHRIEKIANKKDLKELEYQANLLQRLQMVIEKSRQIEHKKETAEKTKPLKLKTLGSDKAKPIVTKKNEKQQVLKNKIKEKNIQGTQKNVENSFQKPTPVEQNKDIFKEDAKLEDLNEENNSTDRQLEDENENDDETNKENKYEEEEHLNENDLDVESNLKETKERQIELDKFQTKEELKQEVKNIIEEIKEEIKKEADKNGEAKDNLKNEIKNRLEQKFSFNILNSIKEILRNVPTFLNIEVEELSSLDSFKEEYLEEIDSAENDEDNDDENLEVQDDNDDDDDDDDEIEDQNDDETIEEDSNDEDEQKREEEEGEEENSEHSDE